MGRHRWQEVECVKAKDGFTYEACTRCGTASVRPQGKAGPRKQRDLPVDAGTVKCPRTCEESEILSATWTVHGT